MDPKHWSVFTRSSNQLLGQPYHATEAGKPPVRGTYAVHGNRPIDPELYRKGKTPSPAERLEEAEGDGPALLPTITLTIDPYKGISRPNSAVDHEDTRASKAFLRATQRLRMGISRPRKSCTDLAKAADTTTSSVGQGLTPYYYNNFDGDLPRLQALTGPQYTRRKSTYIHLFDAVSMPNAIKDEDSGRRDYGEGVADRNLAYYGTAGDP